MLIDVTTTLSLTSQSRSPSVSPSEVTPDGRPWSDARAEHGGPANAIVDVLAWLPASLLYAVLR